MTNISNNELLEYVKNAILMILEKMIPLNDFFLIASVLYNKNNLIIFFPIITAFSSGLYPVLIIYYTRSGSLTVLKK